MSTKSKKKSTVKKPVIDSTPKLSKREYDLYRAYWIVRNVADEARNILVDINTKCHNTSDTNILKSVYDAETLNKTIKGIGQISSGSIRDIYKKLEIASKLVGDYTLTAHRECDRLQKLSVDNSLDKHYKELLEHYLKHFNLTLKDCVKKN